MRTWTEHHEDDTPPTPAAIAGAAVGLALFTVAGWLTLALIL